MLKPKSVIIFSVSGLVLSFLISIFATHNFGWSLLRAIIFGVVFGGLAAGIQFLNGKFLSSADDSFDVSESVAKHSPSQSSGGTVDITIGDERLTEDDKGPQFNVASNRLPLGGKSKPVAPVENKDTSAFGFVPVALGSTKVSPEEAGGVIDPLAPKRDPYRSEAEPVAPVPPPVSSEAVPEAAEIPPAAQSASGKSSAQNIAEEMASQNMESAGPKQLSAKEMAAAKKNAEREADRKEIDSLPDIGDGSFEDISVASGDIIKDSEFAESGPVDPSEGERISLVDGSRAKDHDAETMAKAIRTLLKKDD